MLWVWSWDLSRPH